MFVCVTHVATLGVSAVIRTYAVVCVNVRTYVYVCTYRIIYVV